MSPTNPVRFTYLHGSLTDCGVAISEDCINTTLLNCRVTSHAKQGVINNGKNTKIIGGDICFNSRLEPNVYAAIDAKEKSDGTYCFGVNTGKYHTSSAIYQKHGLLVNSGAKNVQFIGGVLAGLTSDWNDQSGIDTRNNVVVKNYSGDSLDTDNIYKAVVAVNGGSEVIDNRSSRLILNPSSALSNFSITLPNNPTDGQTVIISSTKSITTLTISANKAMEYSPTGIAAGQSINFLYRKSSGRWFPA